MKKIGDIIGKNLTPQQIAALESRLKSSLQLTTLKIEKKFPNHPDDDTYSYYTEDDCILDIILSDYTDEVAVGRISYLNDEGQFDPHGAMRTHNDFFKI